MDAARSAVEAASAWRYTARPKWSSTGESMWMRLSKFSLCNRLSFRALAVLFVEDGDYAASVDLRRAARWKLEALATVLEISATEVEAGFCTVPTWRTPRQASSCLRNCPACLALGFHAAWFQSLLVERCPLHRLTLKSGCSECAAPVPYALGHDLATHPLQCAICACPWVPALARPGGRSAPLERRAIRLFARWAAFVEQTVTDETLASRERNSGRFLATAAPSPSRSTRPHAVTTVNRLFDAPPPLTATLLARRPDRSRQRLRLAAAEPPMPCRALAQWPHFAGRFAQYEAVVRVAGPQLFVVHTEDDPGRWRSLLDAGLVAPRDMMGRATAAWLGWKIAWTSPTRALAPSPQNAMPALGLAGWLANLPLRPQGMSRHDWHLQVLQWLAEDAALSAWIWSRLVAFMHEKGFYVLDGALGPPKDLALWRCRSGSSSGNFTSKVP